MFSLQNKLINEASFAQLSNQLGLLLSKEHPIVIDSRKVISNSIFCAYPGTGTDGRKYIHQAEAHNPACILWEQSETDWQITAPNYPVKNLMHYVGLLAALQNDYPSRKMLAIAVTGTNGKTSISHWLNQAFSYLEHKSAIIGTTGCGIYPDVIDYASTTPDPVTLQNLVDKFVENQVEVLAMEVSSHALTQGRINGMSFTTAIFTNLTQDHLDYHGTMENYFQAKRQLFYWHGLRHAIINADDEYGMRLLKDLEQDNLPLELISYGVHDGILRASDIQLSLDGMSFKLSLRGKTQIINVPIIGKFNVYNLLAVFATLLSNGASWEQLPSIANALQPVVGRMDADIITGKPLVVVDYSHTPDSLEKALTTLQEIPHQKLICVFGCGGNRDKAKRPIMGQIANLYADEVIITTDNPRDEDPDIIIQEIIAGISADNNYQVISDRKDAIATAIKMANHDDIILVAGKGHENYQEIKGIKYPFSDLEIVHNLLVVKE